jgi:probable rRNA maturation factor
MTYVIDVQNDADYPLDPARLQSAASEVLTQHQAAADSALTIVIVEDVYVRDLNRQYRNIDAPTDILSFPADPLPDELQDDGPYLGDLVIAYPYTVQQAAREGHVLEDTLMLLVVHGTLHVLGYDHDTPENKAAMWSAQAAALQALNISAHIVPALEEDTHDTPH